MTPGFLPSPPLTLPPTPSTHQSSFSLHFLAGGPAAVHQLRGSRPQPIPAPRPPAPDPSAAPSGHLGTARLGLGHWAGTFWFAHLRKALLLGASGKAVRPLQSGRARPRGLCPGSPCPLSWTPALTAGPAMAWCAPQPVPLFVQGNVVRGEGRRSSAASLPLAPRGPFPSPASSSPSPHPPHLTCSHCSVSSCCPLLLLCSHPGSFLLLGDLVSNVDLVQFNSIYGASAVCWARCQRRGCSSESRRAAGSVGSRSVMPHLLPFCLLPSPPPPKLPLPPFPCALSRHPQPALRAGAG